ncbi:MAG: RNA chaperone Hfq [Candidatus Riflebacteria bacterium]|nr:RNA chaperone Hfq [Candidatus Riflebacteria bacterium]
MSQYKSQTQNMFLSSVRKRHQPVEVVLNTGTSLRGKIKGFDQFSISLVFREKVEVIYKSAILFITVLPRKQRPMPSGVRGSFAPRSSSTLQAPRPSVRLPVPEDEDIFIEPHHISDEYDDDVEEPRELPPVAEEPVVRRPRGRVSPEKKPARDEDHEDEKPPVSPRVSAKPDAVVTPPLPTRRSTKVAEDVAPPPRKVTVTRQGPTRPPPRDADIKRDIQDDNDPPPPKKVPRRT